MVWRWIVRAFELNWKPRACVCAFVCVFIHFVHRMVQIIWIEIIFQCLPFKMARTLVFIRSCLMWASAHGLCVKSWTQQTRAYFCGIHFKNKARSHTLNASEQLVTIYVHKWRALLLFSFFFFHLCFSIVSLSSFYTMHFQILSIYLVQGFFCTDILLFSTSFLHVLWILSRYKLYIFF